jgi:hypothetical protein
MVNGKLQEKSLVDVGLKGVVKQWVGVVAFGCYYWC